MLLVEKNIRVRYPPMIAEFIFLGTVWLLVFPRPICPQLLYPQAKTYDKNKILNSQMEFKWTISSYWTEDLARLSSFKFCLPHPHQWELESDGFQKQLGQLSSFVIQKLQVKGLSPGLYSHFQADCIHCGPMCIFLLRLKDTNFINYTTYAIKSVKVSSVGDYS